MHFLRFTCGSRKANDGFHETSLRFAKRWMADELQTRDEDWSA
jgi:hypothetical protein